jgi:hypothetical protein
MKQTTTEIVARDDISNNPDNDKKVAFTKRNDYIAN